VIVKNRKNTISWVVPKGTDDDESVRTDAAYSGNYGVAKLTN
jgi:hypothetical protein